jgi:conjugative relaxase-like TrwC/TraI family protein
VAGEWVGLGAERLGLSGKVRADDFLLLVGNQNPSSGETLTQRLKIMRNEDGENAVNRRIFYDFTFSPPKSVSIAALVNADERILDAHARAVKSALTEFEAFASTRVRMDRAQNDRFTKNFVTALFTHDTSRALDPHLHTHCIVFNATFDSVENRWKALQNYGLLNARKFAENLYYHELSRELRGFGYHIRNRARGDFEIEGVSEEICERFSKRRIQVDEGVAKLLADKPELARANLKDLREHLAAEKRTRKQQDLNRDELRVLWESQLTKDERDSLRRSFESSEKSIVTKNRISIAEAVQWAEEHLFDRNSVVLECQIWQQALERARGQGFSVAELKEFTRQRNYIRNDERSGQVTLRDVLLREWEIVQTAKEGIGSCFPLVWHPLPANPQLDDEQRRALDALLGSINAVAVFRGGAGTGKSFVLRELVEQVRQSGRSIVILAPQRQQVVDMEQAGFPFRRHAAAWRGRGFGRAAGH